MVSVRIPDASDIAPVKVENDLQMRPRASAADFGGQIGKAGEQLGTSIENVGAAVGHIAAKLRDESQGATDTVGTATYNVQFHPAAQQLVYDLHDKHPDGGPEYTAALQQGLNDLHQQTLDNIRSQGINLSDRAVARLALANSHTQVDYLSKGLELQQKARVANLQAAQEGNIATINAQVQTGQRTVEDAHKAIDEIVDSSRALYGPQTLLQAQEKWKQGTVDAAIRSKDNAAITAAVSGDFATRDALRAEALALRDKYYGRSAPPAQALHPDFAPKLQQLQQLLKSDYGLDTSIASGARDNDQQAKLYAQGRTAPGPIVTNAPPGSSYHNYGAAVDLKPVNMGEDQAGKVIGRAIQEHPELGLTWGGTFKNLYDPMHVQLGVPLNQLKAGGQYAQAPAQSVTDGPQGPQSNTGPAPIMPNAEKSVWWDKQFQASGMDEERALRLQQKKLQDTSDKAEIGVMQDLYSDQPQQTIQSILARDDLNRQAKERLVGVATRTNKPDPMTKVSQQTATGLLDQMRLPEGDPRRVNSIDPIVDAYVNQKLTKGDFEFLTKQYRDGVANIGTPIGKLRNEFVGNAKDTINLANISTSMTGGAGTFARFEFEKLVDDRIDAQRKAGKDPTSLFMPNSPDYLGKRDSTGQVEILKPFLKSMQKQTAEDAGAITPAPTPEAPARDPADIAAERQRLDDWIRARGGIQMPQPQEPQPQVPMSQ